MQHNHVADFQTTLFACQHANNVETNMQTAKKQPLPNYAICMPACKQRRNSRLGKMTKKQILKLSYNSDKSVAICEFVNIQCSICGFDGSITILFKCRQ